MECIICYNNIENSQLLIKTNCDHTFCKPCLYNWQKKNNNCPLCRQYLLSDNLLSVINRSISTNISDTISITQQLIIQNTNLINSFNETIPIVIKNILNDFKETPILEYIETKNNIKIIINNL